MDGQGLGKVWATWDSSEGIGTARHSDGYGDEEYEKGAQATRDGEGIGVWSTGSGGWAELVTRAATTKTTSSDYRVNDSNAADLPLTPRTSHTFPAEQPCPFHCPTAMTPLTPRIEVKDISLTDYINVNHAVYVREYPRDPSP